jgi:hypothetical protein
MPRQWNLGKGLDGCRDWHNASLSGQHDQASCNIKCAGANMGTEMLRLDMAMDLNSGRQIDPDVQATLSDFLTYSEHLPSTISRSLFLIQSLNRKANDLTLDIHNLLSTYSNLPQVTANATNTPDPVQLRRDISHAYDSLEKCKRMSAAEAIRLEETVVKDATKLQLVQKKLKALPLPPERDPTPDPALTSPQMRRNAQAQQQADKRAAQHRTGTAPRVRAQKIMVPGEVLPPPNPDSPPPSDFSPSPSPPPRSPNHDKSRNLIKTAGRLPKTPKLPKLASEPKEASQKPPRVRLPGSSGTNAHSAVAGISTSNALMALTAPPPDALPGSKWLPWKRLTEYEMATLRKRMKKNAIWVPSQAMRNRELKNLGRGSTAMDEAKGAFHVWYMLILYTDYSQRLPRLQTSNSSTNSTTVHGRIPHAFTSPTPNRPRLLKCLDRKCLTTTKMLRLSIVACASTKLKSSNVKS